MWLNPTIRKQRFSDWSKNIKSKYLLPLRDIPKTKMSMLKLKERQIVIK